MLGMNTETTTSEFDVEFPLTPAWFQATRRLVSTASTQCGFSDRDAAQISMAVDEAMANILKHGYQSDSGGRVKLHVKTQIEPEVRIDIQLDDETNDVDLNLIRSRDLEDIRPGGLGVHLIQTIMDESNWSRRESGGMRLLLSKTTRINSELPASMSENHDG
jgi:anti-sigma regulatory factor (Ser/Thr protein kinase)